MRTGIPKPSPRRRWLTVGALITALAAASMEPSAASTSQSLADAKARLADLNVQLAIIAQQFSVANLKLQQTQSRLDAARQESAAAQSNLIQAMTNLDSRARSAYETGGPSGMLAVLGFTSFDQASAGVQFLTSIAQGDADAATRAEVARRQSAWAAARLRSLLSQQQQLVQGLNARRSQMAAAVAAQQAAIAQIERETAARLAMPKSDPGGAGPGVGPPPLPPPPESEIDALIYSYWGTGKNGQIAECIADRESGDNPYARSPTGAAGIFQLMPFWWDGNNAYGWNFDPYDAKENISHSYLIWQDEGFSPWGGPSC
jgi:hypothetical protein